MRLSHARKQGADPIGIEARFQSESTRAFERNEGAFSIGWTAHSIGTEARIRAESAYAVKHPENRDFVPNQCPKWLVLQDVSAACTKVEPVLRFHGMKICRDATLIRLLRYVLTKNTK